MVEKAVTQSLAVEKMTIFMGEIIMIFYMGMNIKWMKKANIFSLKNGMV